MAELAEKVKPKTTAMIVKIFKTNVKDETLAELLIIYLQKIIPDCLINFDLEDSDRILRISGHREVSSLVINALSEKGIDCTLIP